MALIKCKECGREISDKATACIHCGCPVEVYNQEKAIDSGNGIPNRRVRIIVGAFLFLLVCCGAAWYICKNKPLKSYAVKVELKTDIDTLSYAIGMNNSHGTNVYVYKEFGLDTITYVEQFSEGFKEGIYKESVSISDEELKGEGKDKDMVARLLGIKLGCQFNNQIVKVANRELFANDTVRSVSLPIITMGFLDGIANQFNIMTVQEAFQKGTEIAQKITEEKRLKEEQEREARLREEEKQKAQAMSSIIGTYTFSPCEDNYASVDMYDGRKWWKERKLVGYIEWIEYLVVMEDGRVSLLSPSQRKFVGTVSDVSNGAFVISINSGDNARVGAWTTLYRNGNDIGQLGSKGYGFPNNVVIDTNTRRVYNGVEDYKNKDISDVEYIMYDSYSSVIETSNDTEVKRRYLTKECEKEYGM